MQTGQENTNESNEPAAPPGVELSSWDDMPRQRELIFNGAKKALSDSFPRSYGGVRLELHDLHYADPEEYSIKEQKEALMQNKFLNRRLRGTLKLFDSSTGVQIDEKPPMTLMRVPYLTERGTWIHGGSEYTHSSQSRLLPGVYTRRRENGEVESHVNTKRGTGRSFRLTLEPDTGLFKVNVGQSSLRLYSLLHDLGIPDSQMEKSWGPELLATNKAKYDPRTFDKAYTRLAKRPDPKKTREEKVQEIKAALSAGRLDRSVLNRTLPNLFVQKQAAAAPGAPQQTPQTQQQDAGKDFQKKDYQLLGEFLNKTFHAGIPLDLPAPIIAQYILEDLKKLMPGTTSDGLSFALSQHQKKFNDYEQDPAG